MDPRYCQWQPCERVRSICESFPLLLHAVNTTALHRFWISFNYKLHAAAISSEFNRIIAEKFWIFCRQMKQIYYWIMTRSLAIAEKMRDAPYHLYKYCHTQRATKCITVNLQNTHWLCILIIKHSLILYCDASGLIQFWADIHGHKDSIWMFIQWIVLLPLDALHESAFRVSVCPLHFSVISTVNIKTVVL